MPVKSKKPAWMLAGVSREEWLAERESEFGGYDPDPLVFDSDDPAWLIFLREEQDVTPLVTPYELEVDRAALRDLRREELNAEIVGPDGSMTIRGANPFSTDEGAAEWLARVRSELRCEYRKASSATERKAIVAREAGLRARHNARCFGRAVAAYYGVDESTSVAFLDSWHKGRTIGWLGLESAMRSMFEGCEKHFFEARESWDAEFRPHWDDETKDEWLARMPEPPQYPTALVSSVKKLRSHATVARRNTLPRGPWAKDWAKAHPQAVAQLEPRAGTEVPVGAGFTPGQARFYAQVAQRPGWFDERREWERAEMLTPERLVVPESLDFSGPGELDDVPAFVPSSFQPLHRCGERCVVCDSIAA